MKKSFYFMLTIVLMASIVLAACSSSNESANNNGVTSEKGSSSADNKTADTGSTPVKLTVFSSQNADMDLTTNWFTKRAAQLFNINFDWQVTTHDTVKEKRGISLASGDYPDLFLLSAWDSFSQADQVKYGQQGVFLPLNSLIEQHAPNITSFLDSTPGAREAVTSPDGNIYGMMIFNNCYHCSYPNKMWLNTAWLETLNMQMPTTTEEFKAVLEAFKTKDPNGNGKMDEIPLSGAIQAGWGVGVYNFLMNAFINFDEANYFVMNNGKVELSANKTEWKQGLEYLASLYKAGLIDTGSLSQNTDAYKKLGTQEPDNVLGAAASMHTFNFGDPEQERWADYEPLAPIAGPGGVQSVSYTGNVPSTGASFVLTNKAGEAQQVAAIKLLDYFFTDEGQTEGYFGEKGVTWDDATADQLGLDGQPAKRQELRQPEGSDPVNSGWLFLAQYMVTNEYRSSWASASDIHAPEGAERRFFEATKIYEPYKPDEVFPTYVWMDPSDVDEATLLKTNIVSYIQQSSAEFIAGVKDINRDWDNYVKGLENLKVDRYLEIYQAAYDNTF